MTNGINNLYNARTAIGRGANAGINYAKSIYAGSASSAFQYTTKDESTGLYSIDGGLAFSIKSLEPYKADGKVTAQEFGESGKYVDLNSDGEVSAAENLAYIMFQDATGDMNGAVSTQESKTAQMVLSRMPDYARDSMMKLFNGHNLEQREKNLILPELPAVTNTEKPITDTPKATINKPALNLPQETTVNKPTLNIPQQKQNGEGYNIVTLLLQRRAGLTTSASGNNVSSLGTFYNFFNNLKNKQNPQT